MGLGEVVKRLGEVVFIFSFYLEKKMLVLILIFFFFVGGDGNITG